MTKLEQIAYAVRGEVEWHERHYGDRWPLDGRRIVACIADTLGDDERDIFLSDCGLPGLEVD